MKREMQHIRKGVSLLFIVVLMMTAICGCEKKEVIEKGADTSVTDLINEKIGDTDSTENTEGVCPEGYVYDYQVSDEPIPEEIAALGGEVCGTMHAFPSRIEAALMEQKLAEDSELNAENEKCMEDIQKYLKETYCQTANYNLLLHPIVIRRLTV